MVKKSLVKKLGLPAVALASALTVSGANAQGTQASCDSIQAKPGNGYTVCLHNGANSELAVFDGFNPSPQVRDRGLLSVFNPLDYSGLKVDASNFRLSEEGLRNEKGNEYDISNTQGLSGKEKVVDLGNGLAVWQSGDGESQYGYLVVPKKGEKVVDMKFAKGSTYDAGFKKHFNSAQVAFDAGVITAGKAVILAGAIHTALKGHGGGKTEIVQKVGSGI